MSLRRMCKRISCIGLAALALAGCRDDPAPKGETTPKAIPHIKDSVRKGQQIQRLSPEAMKLYRMEVCYFGGLGLRGTRDAYLASLGDKPPSPDHIPSFGVAKPEPPAEKDSGDAAPEAVATAAPKAQPSAGASAKPVAGKAAPERIKPGRDRMKERMKRRPFRARLPYTRHIRSCTVAKKLKQPAAPELDAAAAKFETYAIGLHKLVHEAHRYYSRDQFEKDEFKRGKELHEELTKQFAELDANLDGFASAYQAWRKKIGAPPDKLDEGGELSEKAVAKGRALTLLLWAKDEWNKTAIATAIEEAQKALEALEAYKDKEQSSVHVRMVAPHLRRMIDAAKKAAEELEEDKLSTEVLFDATFAYVAAVDANHQALARALNPKIRRPRDAARVKRPDVKRIRPPLRRPPKPPSQANATE